MARRKRANVDSTPYSYNDDISVTYAFTWGKKEIIPGNLIKFKRERGQFRFRCVAYNERLDKLWIDCYSVSTGELRSFYANRLKGPVSAKRSRQKKDAQRT